MSSTAPATAPPARSSRGKDMMRTTQPAAVGGLSSVPPAASSATSTSITPTIQASSANAPDFFNSLLDVGPRFDLARFRQTIDKLGLRRRRLWTRTGRDGGLTTVPSG